MSYNMNDLNNALAEARYQVFSFNEYAKERVEKLEKAKERVSKENDALFNEYMSLLKAGKSEDASEAERKYNDSDDMLYSLNEEMSCLTEIMDELEEISFGRYTLTGFDEDLNDSLISGE